jgi:23S rRNA pseudouridine1911/1915/1917 synthase
VDHEPLEILFEDNHCIALCKPAGILTTHYQGKEETLDRQVKRYLKQKYKKPGNVFLGVVHRLDRLVSGVVLFARTSKAAARIAEQFRSGTVHKTYWAIVEGRVPEPSGILEDYLVKDEKNRAVVVAAKGKPGARHAILRFERQIRSSRSACRDNLSLLRINPETGRTHQIRVQVAHRGYPIWGDRKYGSTRAFGSGIALHARSLKFCHPTRDEEITLTAELPAAWSQLLGSFLAEVRP